MSDRAGEVKVLRRLLQKTMEELDIDNVDAAIVGFMIAKNTPPAVIKEILELSKGYRETNESL